MLILDRDGRALPFDARRLDASIRRILSVLDPGGSSAEAEDLSRVVGRFLECSLETARSQSQAQGQGSAGTADPAGVATSERTLSVSARTLSAETLAGYVFQVLQGAGHEEAARLYAQARNGGGRGLAVRVSDLIEAEVELPRAEAVRIGEDVERGLLAAGLRDPSVGLLREWVDHSLRQKGVGRSLSARPSVGLAAGSLRNLLRAGKPGLAAEQRCAEELLRTYALRDILPSDVAAAHASGRLDMGGLASRSRVHGVCLAPWSLPALRQASPAGRIAMLGEVLRELAELTSHEVRVLWNGPAPTEPDLQQLEHQLVAPHGGGARIVLCVDGSRADLVRAFLARPSLTRACRIRIHGPQIDSTLLPEIAARSPAQQGYVEVTRRGPRPGVVAGSCAVNLLRHALMTRGEEPGRFLDLVQEAAGLAAAGLAAWHDLGLGVAAADAIAERLGQRLPESWWLEPAGMVQARVVLLGAGGRARDNGRDLAVAVGERLRLGWSERWPNDPGEDVWAPEREANGPSNLELLPASARAQRRFQRLDLPSKRSPARRKGGASEQEPLGEGETFSHDGEADPAARGREVVLLRRCLGCAGHAPAPRKASDAGVRESFLRAFLEPSLDEADIAPCA